MGDRKPNFGGWVTVYDKLCTDGKTIRHGAFKHENGKKVPLIWQHNYDTPRSILGNVILEDRDEGVYGYGFLNQSELAQSVKHSIQNSDIDRLSIHANRLRVQESTVLHGNLVEVSLVLAGANPGAIIDQVDMTHGEDGESEAWIYTDEIITHSADLPNKKAGDTVADENKVEDSEETVNLKSVYDNMSDEQKALLNMIADKVEANVRAEYEQQDDKSDDESDAKDDKSEDKKDKKDDEEVKHSDDKTEETLLIHSEGMSADDILTHIDSKIQEGLTDMSRNVFDRNNEALSEGPTLTHSQFDTIMSDAKKNGSLKESFLTHAQEYGIENIDLLFPDAKALSNTPEVLGRRTEWVASVNDKARHTPFSRIKSIVADITADEARARGYVKTTMKKDEVISLLKRTTSPTTIYKKQKLDRDDIVDITDLDIVAFLKAEMRVMLEEELARAILLGDGREADDADKIKDPVSAQDGVGIRSIANDHDMYARKVKVNELNGEDLVDKAILSRTHYRGSGTPVMYTTERELTKVLLHKDTNGRRIYKSVEEVAAAARVSSVIPVEAMEDYPSIAAIIVHMPDYTIGADKGGKLTMFDDFDINYNQEQYLMETRVSGALTKPRSAIVMIREDLVVVEPDMPSFDSSNRTLDIPNIPGVEYRIDDDVVRGRRKITATTEVTAHAKTGFTMKTDTNTAWTFTVS